MAKQWEQFAAALCEADLLTDFSSKIYARAMFLCEYCDQSILEHMDSWHGSACDHILPQSKYQNLRYDINNNALSCKACNDLKRDWDVAEADRELHLSVSELTPAQRDSFIRLCRTELEKRRATSQNNVNRIKQILLDQSQT